MLKKFNLRGATNKIIWLVIHGDRQKLSLEHGTTEQFMVEKQFQANMFSVFSKVVYTFRRFNRNRELIPNCWHSHRESTFANIQLSFCLETNDLRVLEISEKW